MVKSRKISAAGCAVVLLGGTLFAFFPAMRASWEIHRFCDELPLGTASAVVLSRASARGYGVEPLEAGRVVVEHPRSLGRAYCDLSFDARGQLAAKVVDN